jgi:hypothetical protein
VKWSSEDPLRCYYGLGEIFTSLRLVVIGDVRFSEHGVPATAF